MSGFCYNLLMTDIRIFTDGSSRGNPGPGGWGAIVIEDDMVREIGGKSVNTTNNRMELSAAIEALNILKKSGTITIFTDSSYVLKGATLWLSYWKKNGWKTKTKSDVLNKDLWQKFDKLISQKRLMWQLLPGHSGVSPNERCDFIATSFADNKKIALYHGPIAKYDIDISNVSIPPKSKKNKNSNKRKAYSYVSEVSGVVMSHKTWGECENRVKGKSGARFKKVFSNDEEKKLISQWKKDIGI